MSAPTVADHTLAGSIAAIVTAFPPQILVADGGATWLTYWRQVQAAYDAWVAAGGTAP